MIKLAKDLSPIKEERINQLKEISNVVWHDNPVMAKAALAQAILESGLNNRVSGLAQSTNNLFGIKGTGDAGSSRQNTQEVINGRTITVREGFAAYTSLEAAFKAHRELLTTHPRYAEVITAKTAVDVSRELQASGYATDPRYALKILSVLKQLEDNV